MFIDVHQCTIFYLNSQGINDWIGLEGKGIRLWLDGRLLGFQLSSWEGIFSSYLPEKAILAGDREAISCIHQSAPG
jgi:hypothetical protein